MTKILTVVVPSYNAADYLLQTIPTMTKVANSKDIEILIINDGSTDNTLWTAKELEEKYPGVVYVIDKENGGHGSAINSGIKHARGKYFKVIDADDWVDSNNFNDLISFLSVTDVDEIVSPYNDVWEDTRKINKVDYFGDSKLEPMKSYDYKVLLEDIGILPRMHSITIKTSLLQENNIKIDENMFYVDTEYIVYPTPFIKTIAYTSEAIYQYRRGFVSQSTSLKNYIKNREMVKQVSLSLIDFYNSFSLTDITDDLVKDTIKRSVTIASTLCFHLADSQKGKHELIEYDEMLKQSNSIFYHERQGLKSLLMKISKYRLFGTVAYFVKKRPKL